MANAITTIEKAARMLAEATTLEDILRVENLAQRARDYARAADWGREAQNTAAVICLDARRKAGETLAEMKERGELAERVGRNGSQAATHLEDIGLTKSQSSRYQAEASVPQEAYREWVQSCQTGDHDITATGLRKLAKQLKATEPQEAPPVKIEGVVGTLQELIDQGTRFACVYADPPWKYGNQGTRAATDNHYGTMTVAEICAEPVGGLCEDDAVLFLWTTSGFLRESFDVIDAWGFTYKSNMVWVKPQMGIGNYVRLCHEHLMIAVRGKGRTNGKSQRSDIRADRTRHSAKPRVFRETVERLAVGPYLEMYGREAIDGWTVYGNQIEARLFS